MAAPPDGERAAPRAILRRDHVAGGIFVLGAALVFACSGDLPFGTLASPGAGMMPKIVLALLMLFGAVLVLRAGESPPLAAIAWSDLRHAATVVAVAAVAIALYVNVGFIVSIALMVFVLLYVVERRRLVPALAVAVGVTASCYYAFGTLLKSPLPPMPWF